MRTLIFSMLIAVGIIISGCKESDENTTSGTTGTNDKDVTSEKSTGSTLNGEYNATGTITFTIGSENYSCNISKVIASSVNLSIQTASDNVRTTGNITVVCYTPASPVVPGTYTMSSTSNIASVTFLDKSFSPYSAAAGSNGASCSVTISSLTPTSIQGTFTATVLKALDNSKLDITNGVINCTIGAK